MRPRISYANVVSTLALILALGGVSYAAVRISGKSIKNRTVGAVKIKKNSLTGTEINEAKLGKVPLAALADSATNAGNANTVGGQAPSAFKLSCPSGTTLAIGECFETSLRPDAKWTDANKTCGAAGRRVPTLSELDGIRQNNFTVGVPPNNYELSSTFELSGTGDTQVVMSMDPMGNLLAVPLTGTKPYRCVTTPTN